MPKQQQKDIKSATMIKKSMKRDSPCHSEASQALADEPASKRARGVPLNFSIESIMQPAHPLLASGPNQHNQFASRSATPASGSLSPSPDSERLAQIEHFSRSGSPASIVSAGSACELACGRLSSRCGSDLGPASGEKGSPAGSPGASSSISRASTPISLGCCDARHNHQSRPNSLNNTNSTQFNERGQQANANQQQYAPTNGFSSSPSSQSQQRPSKVGPSASNGGKSSSRSGAHSSGSGSNSYARERAAGSSNALLRQPVCTDQRLAPFRCHLDNLDLWHRFHPLDTEMIITKQGRRMFPPVRVTFSLDEMAGCSGAASAAAAGQLQLNGRDKYQVLMDILPYDSKRYRYAYHRSSWQQAGKADPASPTKLFLHPDGPFTLDQLKRQSVISFEKIKLTNNDANKHGYIVLNSMHKYQPRIHLVLWRGKESQNLANGPISLLDNEPHKTFIFSETIFTAVTAYQNHSITKLKIEKNPFAKGFRDSTRLTDMELESMQDLVDGQCPFSPPRAPPPGFPHFLFGGPAAPQPFGLAPPPPPPGGAQSHLAYLSHPAAPVSSSASSVQQAPGQPQMNADEEAAAVVMWRERTIIALDSLFQQQQQQQHQQQQQQQQHQASCEMAQSLQGQLASQAARLAAESPGGGTGPHQQPPTSQAGGPLELQFLVQEQQRFAAAMAAAAAAAAAAQQHHLPHPLHQLFAAQAGAQPLTHSPQLPGAKTSGTPTSQSHPQPMLLAQQHPAQPMPTSATQTSPIGAAKTAARNQMQQLAAPSHPEGISQADFQAHQLQALMFQHHQQMAALSAMQQHQQRPQAAHPALVLADGRPAGAVRDKRQSPSRA